MMALVSDNYPKTIEKYIILTSYSYKKRTLKVKILRRNYEFSRSFEMGIKVAVRSLSFLFLFFPVTSWGDCMWAMRIH